MSRAMTGALMSICGGGVIALVLAGCSTAGEDRYGDIRRCSEYRNHSECAYYRDRERLINQEKALINAEQARENLRMLREIRRRRGE
jgi:hypothetical protein